ncbi:MAG TPA: hemerythrin domain-containing protein [Planctomycetota bacterium]|nr:hemerythrin domain-containing protein [Planctomycetota bacterium]
MPDSRLKAMNATSLLRDDHKRFKELLRKYEKLSDEEVEQKEDIFAMLKAELDDHATIEEEIFYPATREVQVAGAGEIVEAAVEEHAIVRTLLEELSELEAGDVEFEAKMKVLKENVEHHAHEEEMEVFPLFRKLPHERQDEVSERLRARKFELSEGDWDDGA